MKGLGRKVTFITLAAVLATAMMGVAYSLWFEDLKLTATVTTGTLDGQIFCGALSDNESTVWPPPPNPAPPPFSGYPRAIPLKDVATGPSTSATPDGHTYTITVGGAYPGMPWTARSISSTRARCHGTSRCSRSRSRARTTRTGR